MKNKNYFIIAFISLALVLTSCENEIFYIEGNRDIVTETLQLDDFTGIQMNGAEDVEIFYGEEQEVIVTGDANIIERIKTDVFNGVWHMELERGNYRHYDLKYFITLPQINELSNDGAAKVVINDFVNEGDLYINMNGAGDFEINRLENTENIYISMDGAGHVEALGEIPSLNYLEIYISGAGEFNGYTPVAYACNIEIDGTAKCQVSVENQLDVNIDGAGAVYYKGYPNVKQSVSGLGVIESRN